MLNAGGEDTARAYAEIVAGVYERSAGLLAVAATAAEADEALAACKPEVTGAGCVTAPRSSTGCTTTAGSITAFIVNDAADTLYALGAPRCTSCFASSGDYRAHGTPAGSPAP